LLAHIRRWKAKDIVIQAVIEENGRPVASVKKGFASAVRLAQLDKHVTPHTLRHTSATWMMQEGVDLWEAAGFLGMSVQVLESVYGHHHPKFQASITTAFQKPKKAA
jgi:integrase